MREIELRFEVGDCDVGSPDLHVLDVQEDAACWFLDFDLDGHGSGVDKGEQIRGDFNVVVRGLEMLGKSLSRRVAVQRIPAEIAHFAGVWFCKIQ